MRLFDSDREPAHTRHIDDTGQEYRIGDGSSKLATNQKVVQEVQGGAPHVAEERTSAATLEILEAYISGEIEARDLVTADKRRILDFASTL